MSFFSTGIVTTSPACTVTSSAAACGGCNRVGAGTGITRTWPVAVSVPLEAVYSTVTGASRRRISVTRSIWCARIATDTPASAGTRTDWTTRTPPAGSVSLASTSTRVDPPAGSRAVSVTTIGAPAASEGGSTSTRTRPVVAFGPSVTWYVRSYDRGSIDANVNVPAS